MASRKFFAELKRRNVYKVAVAYAVGAWLIIQVASIVLPTFHAPEWTLQAIIALLAIGFPAALVCSWAFEITTEGIVRESEIESGKSITRGTGRKIVAITVVLAIIAVGLLAFQLLRPSKQVAVEGGAPATPNESSNGLALHGESSTGARPSISAKSIAVLPFENLSDDKGAAYFAEGIQDEILTKLASIADLKVISRTSTTKYKSKPEDLKTVSQQLGVANVLEGSVQKAAGKVRVNVQLIDARADSHLWAKTYDRDLADVFAIQSEVAQEIADSLKAKLSAAEANTMLTAPTKDMQAYDLFLKGEFEQRVAHSNFRSESFDQAARWYKGAIARDPNFALAIAQLAICQLRRHWLTEPLSEAEVVEAGRLANQALTLAPDLAEAHVAVGLFHYYGFREYEAALTEFRRAIELQPNNSLALLYVTSVYRRQAKWDRALDELKKATDLDPRNPTLVATLAETCVFLRRWRDAEQTARHVLTIDPHEALSMRMLLISSLNQSGNAQECLPLLASFPPDDLLLPNTGTYDMVIGTRGEFFVLGRDFDAALKAWETGAAAATSERQRLAAKATIRVLAGDVAGAQSDAEKARELLEAWQRGHLEDVRSLRALSWTYLALNRKTDAINTARKSVELLPLDKDAVLGSGNLAALAEMQAQTGAVNEAVENLRRLLSIPAGETISIARLKIDPVWDPIRNDPSFQQLLSGKELIGPNE